MLEYQGLGGVGAGFYFFLRIDYIYCIQEGFNEEKLVIG